MSQVSRISVKIKTSLYVINALKSRDSPLFLH
jgi:hypothetical protein